MKNLRFLALLVALATPTALVAQSSFYAVNKQQNFLQTSGPNVAADPNEAFVFQAISAVAATLTLPNGTTMAFRHDPGDNQYEVRQSFATKAAMDAAFPNGTYRITGSGIPALTITVGADNYPEATPQVTSVTNGTWGSGGTLVVNPAQACTLNFSNFATYATSGLAGHMNFYLTGMTDNMTQRVTLESQRFSQPVFGNPAQPSPLTSYTIPAGTLVPGRVYKVWLDFDTVAAMDLTTVPGGGVGNLFTKTVVFYIGAQNPGTSVPPPVIVSPPTSRVAAVGGNTTFTIGVTVGGNPINYLNSGATPIGFEWWHNGLSVGDPNSSGGKYSTTGGDTLTINSLTAADAGEYTVTVYTAGGVVTTLPATLTLAATSSAPAITSQPQGATVNAGSTVAFTVAATGSPTPAYQWRKDGTAIANATSDTLLLTNIAPAAAGNYSVLVTNSAGSVVSNNALLAVTSGQPSRLPNLSVRTNLAASQTLIVGFATSGSKNMLVRGIGPTLGAFGLSGVLADPTIELYSSAAAKIDENNDWSAGLGAVFREVGAFALTDGSKDAALRRECTGAYTAQIKGPGSGVVLVEVYDTGGAGKLMNVSARNLVGTGDNILIAGFVVDGTAAKTLLIRGVGAKLAEFGVAGVLADPKLEIYSGSTKIAENDNWNALLQPLARSVGAFDLTLGSRDAALLITLPPGTYTAQISGVGGGTGEAIVEVYEVP